MEQLLEAMDAAAMGATVRGDGLVIHVPAARSDASFTMGIDLDSPTMNEQRGLILR